jgi:hypothetical protein
VYNLVHWGEGEVPHPPSDHRKAQLRAAIKAWEADDEGPPFLVHLLAHQYTTLGLGFSGLKGEDSVGGRLLASAASRGMIMAYLAKFEFWDDATATEVGYRYAEWEVRGRISYEARSSGIGDVG